MMPFDNVSFQSVNLIDLIDYDVPQTANTFREFMQLVCRRTLEDGWADL